MRVIAYPRAGANPYQDLLYRPLVDAGRIDVEYLNGTRGVLLLFPLVLAVKRIRGFRVFHLHWPAFYVAGHRPGRRRLSRWLCVLCLRAVKVLGYRLVWTVHNIVPHRPETTDDLAVARLAARLSDAKIVHSAATVREMAELGLDTAGVHVIPHGHYADAYPRGVSRGAARERLGVAPDAFVFLFFGRAEAYKGVPALVEAFRQVALDHPAAHLVVAGSGAGREALPALEGCPEDVRRRVLVVDTFVPDDEVQVHFAAADVCVLPFVHITTSGSVVLAASFGVPVIVPLVAALDDAEGFRYEPGGLAGCMDQVIRHPDEVRRRAARASRSVADRSWDEIATRTIDVLAGPEPRRAVPVGGAGVGA